MKYSQWLVLGMGSVIAGVTVWLAAYGEMPEELGQVVTGSLLSLACIAWALIGLEEQR
jgi:hypothetical protein